MVIPVMTRGGDLIRPAGDGYGQRDELGGVVVPAHQSQQANSRSLTWRSQGVEPMMRARRFSASRSYSFAIQAAAIFWPYRSRSRMRGSWRTGRSSGAPGSARAGP
jgi:hypothetical protein